MFIYSTFGFIYFPKTAGTYCQRLFTHNGFGRAVEHGRPHHGVDNLPPDKKDLPIFGFTRNPWDWYVSWWSYSKDKMHLSNSFKQAILKHTKTSHQHVGFMTKLYVRNYHGSKFLKDLTLKTELPKTRVIIVKFEEFKPFLSGYFLGKHNKKLKFPDGQVNKSQRKQDYKEYYDEELREFIEERDAMIIEKFGYSFSS